MVGGKKVIHTNCSLIGHVTPSANGVILLVRNLCSNRTQLGEGGSYKWQHRASQAEIPGLLRNRKAGIRPALQALTHDINKRK